MKVAVCAILKNEERSLEQWLAYHVVLGVEHFRLYDNGSTDETAEIIRRWSDRVSIDYIYWESTDPRFQFDAYDDALTTIGSGVDWTLFIDADEYFVPTAVETVSSFLIGFGDDVAAVAVNWAIYGSNGHTKAPDRLVIEAFTRRAELDFGPNHHVKSFVRSGCATRSINPHMFEVIGRYVDVSGSDVDWIQHGLARTPVRLDPARIHHYFVQSQSHWDAKMRRGYNDIVRVAEDFQQYDRNEVEDLAAARFAPAVNELLKR